MPTGSLENVDSVGLGDDWFLSRECSTLTLLYLQYSKFNSIFFW